MDQEALVKLSKDLKKASSSMTRSEARYLIGLYLTMQHNRKAADQKIMKMEERAAGEPHAVLQWASDNAYALEKQILGALEVFAEEQVMGKWALAIHGVGPVIAAGLLAHVDLEPWTCSDPKKNEDRKPADRCREDKPCSDLCKRVPIETVGHLWAFAGLDPSKKWGKGEKRPHNAALKQICYYAGECFIRTKGNEAGYYGKLYDSRKEYEQKKNEAGEYAEQAKKVLESRPTHAQKKIYQSGKLPPGHLHARARRYAVKQFLADWWSEAYRQHYKKEPPKPYPIAILGHAHERKAA